MEFSEFQPVVAPHTWVRGPTLFVFIDEVIDDAPKVLFEIANVERHPKLSGNLTCICSIIDGTAALVTNANFCRVTHHTRGIKGFKLIKCVTRGTESHEATDDFMTFSLQHRGRNRRINPPTHGDQDLCHAGILVVEV